MMSIGEENIGEARKKEQGGEQGEATKRRNVERAKMKEQGESCPNKKTKNTFDGKKNLAARSGTLYLHPAGSSLYMKKSIRRIQAREC